MENHKSSDYFVFPEIYVKATMSAQIKQPWYFQQNAAKWFKKCIFGFWMNMKYSDLSGKEWK